MAGPERQTFSSVYRFGAFEAHIPDGILLRAGTRIRLQGLPFEMLQAMLERPGEVVTRQELRQRLWRDDAFGDFDNGLNVVAAKLREALGEQASNPIHIKTASGQGYQFLGVVTRVSEPVSNPTPVGASPQSPAPSLKEAPFPAPAESIPLPGRRTIPTSIWRSILLWSIVTGLLLTVIVSIFFIQRRSSTPLAGASDKIVLGAFSNHTGDPIFEGTLAPPWRLKLEESPYLSLISDWRQGESATQPRTDSIASDLQACNDLHAQILLTGTIETRGQEYDVAMTAWRCRDGSRLATETAVADARATVLTALGKATEAMRKRLGEPVDAVRRFNVPLVQATTSSLAALKAFTIGDQKRRGGIEGEAVSDYKIAIDLDPNFALAYARIGTIYLNMGESLLAREFYQKAFALRERTTDQERLYITSHYYTSFTGELFRAAEADELWRTIYPRELAPVNNLANLYLTLGQPEKALSFAKTSVDLEPSPLSYATLAAVYRSMGDYDKLAALCTDPAHRDTGVGAFHVECFQLAFVRNDEAGMQRQLQWAQHHGHQSPMLAEVAWNELFHGKLKMARQTLRSAQDNAVREHLTYFAAQLSVSQAVLEADLGFMPEARVAATSALKLIPDSADMDGLAALAFTRGGDLQTGQAAASKATSLAPLDTLLNLLILPTANAAAALTLHKPEAAVHALEVTGPLDLSPYMVFAPVYYRGLAYLQLNQPAAAAKEFQRVLDRRAFAPDSLYVVLSELELAHSLSLAGKPQEAAPLYVELNRIWKDADPGFPPLQHLRHYE